RPPRTGRAGSAARRRRRREWPGGSPLGRAALPRSRRPPRRRAPTGPRARVPGPPGGAPPDSHRDDVIALGIERLEYRAGRGQRDVVLGRAAARQDGDPGARHYGGSGVVGAPNLPTAIVTTLPGAAWVPPGGSWVWTIPPWLGSVTGWVTMCTPKPEALSCAWASFCESVVTSGTVDVVGPLATVRVMIAPGGCRVPALGVMSMTVSFG